VERLLVDPRRRSHALVFNARACADLLAKVVALWELATDHTPDPKGQHIVPLSVGIFPSALIPLEGEAHPCDPHLVLFQGIPGSIDFGTHRRIWLARERQDGKL